MAYSNLADALAIPTALLVAGSWIDASVHLIHVAGYAVQGDGGDCFWQDFGPNLPPHSCFLGPSLDGRYWGPGQSEIDPRALGAKADGVIFADGTIAPNKLNQLTIGGYQFSAKDIGKPICVTSHLGLFSGPLSDAGSNTVFTVIVNVVAGSGTCTLGANIPAAASGLSGWFGSDDSGAINAVLTASGYQYVNPLATNAPFNTSFGGQVETVWQIGTIRLHFRDWASNQVQIGSAETGRLHALYVVASPVFFTSGAEISFDQGVKVIASPAWNGAVQPGAALMMNVLDSSGNPVQCWENVFEDLNLDGMGVVPIVFWFASGQFATFNGEQTCKQPRVTGGVCVKIGPGVNAYGGFCTSLRGASSWTCQAQSANLATYLGNTSIGFQFALQSYNNHIGWNMVIAGFATGYEDDGVGNCINGEIQVYTLGAYGYMPVGAYFNGCQQAFVERLFVDTPCKVGLFAYGAYFTNADVTIGELRAYADNGFKDNAGALLTTNGAIVCTSYYIGQPKGSRTLIKALKCQRSDSTILWHSVVDTSNISSAGAFQVNDFSGDGSWSYIGYTDWRKISQKTALVNAASACMSLTACKKRTNASAVQLWTPDELNTVGNWGTFSYFSGLLNYWLDASLVPGEVFTPFGPAAIGNGSSIAQWHSRRGNGLGIQTYQPIAPVVDTTGGWTIGTGFMGQSIQVNFDGVLRRMELCGGWDPAFPPFNAGQIGSTQIYVFMVLTPLTIAGSGLIARLGAASWSAEIWQDGANAKFYAVGQGQAGTNETGVYVSGTPVILTGYFDGAANAAGAKIRLNCAQTYIAGNNLGSVAGDGGMLGAVPGNPFTSFAKFNLAELLVYNNLGDTTNDWGTTQSPTRIIEAYLAWKWGQQALLPASHPFGSGGTNAPPVA